jgi:hypothetical protein
MKTVILCGAMLKLAYPLAAVLAAASIAAAAPAQATPDSPDSNDGAFLTELGIYQILTTSQREAIQTAHDICRAMRSGYSSGDMVPVVEAKFPGMSKTAAPGFVYASMEHYCPEFT